MTDQDDSTPAGDPAPGGLPEDLYDELRALARRELARLPARLDATDVLHTAWLALQQRFLHLGRSNLLPLFATTMRHILVDEIRRFVALRHIDSVAMTLAAEPETPALDVVQLEDALAALRLVDERWARIVELRYFGGATEEEVAGALGMSRSTVGRDWLLARAWLKRRLTDTTGNDRSLQPPEPDGAVVRTRRPSPGPGGSGR